MKQDNEQFESFCRQNIFYLPCNKLLFLKDVQRFLNTFCTGLKKMARKKLPELFFSTI